MRAAEAVTGVAVLPVSVAQLQVSLGEYEHLFARTRWIKDRFKRYERYWPLEDRTLAMIFEKQSTRTRLSFEAGMHQLGGAAIFLSTRDSQLGRGEPVEDAAQVISRMCDVVMIRTFEQDTLERFARQSRVPVINGLSDVEHPCQALADALTIRDRLGALEGVRVAWVGDGSNVLTSLAALGELLGYDVVAASPVGYEASEVDTVLDPREAVAAADVVVTDTWISMGQEHERERRLRDLEAYRLDDTLLALAAPDAFVLHCLPAHAGEEATTEVLYGGRSAIWDEAENRLHVQKALLALLLGVV